MLCHCSRQDTATNLTLGFGWVVCFVSQGILSNLKIAGFFFFFFRSRKMETDSGEFFFFNQMLTKCYLYNSGRSRGGARRPNEAQRADKERGDRPRPCPRPPFGWNRFLYIPFQRRNSWHSKCTSCFQPRLLLSLWRSDPDQMDQK